MPPSGGIPFLYFTGRMFRACTPDLLQRLPVLKGVSDPPAQAVISLVYCIKGNRAEFLQAQFAVVAQHPFINTHINYLSQEL